MRDFFKRHWPLFTSIGILWLTIGIILIISMNKNHGYFIYGLDDAYIHLSIARNFAQYGIWGVTKHGFSSSSSSLLWDYLLSLIFLVFQQNALIPFILNIMSATALIVVVYLILYNYSIKALYTFIILLLIIYLTPLPQLIFSGMEHVSQILITILFFYYSAKNLAAENPIPPSYQYLPLILAPLVTLVRFEGLFVVFVVFLLLLRRRRYIYALSLGMLACLPIFSYAIISIAHGWFWLPNSVLLKGHSPQLTSIKEFTKFLILPFVESRNLLLILMLLISIFIYIYRTVKGKFLWEFGQIMLFSFIALTTLHILFIGIGWFYRYEAYLVAIAIMVIGITLIDSNTVVEKLTNSNKRVVFMCQALIILLFITITPFLYNRGTNSLLNTVQASTNIYEQQYQMGLFLKKFYQGKHIAANDIGAINYLADINCLDLWGLGTLEVAQMRINKIYDQRQIYKLANSSHVQIAIVYDRWFTPYGGLPPQWIKVAQWKIAHNVVCGSDTVSFYAVNPAERNHLLSNLKRFATELPHTVKIELCTDESPTFQ